MHSESSAGLRASGSAEAMVKTVEGLPEDVMPVQQIEQAVYARVIADKPRVKIPSKPVTFPEGHRKSLSTLMSSLDIVEGGIFEESREWPHPSKGPEVVSEVVQADRHPRSCP